MDWSVHLEKDEANKIKNYLKEKGYAHVYYPVYGSVSFLVHKDECVQMAQEIQNLTSLSSIYVHVRV
jgi:hypothetical protein